MEQKTILTPPEHVFTRVTVIHADERTRDTAQTSGMTREQAIRTDIQWTGFVQTEPGMISGWHHHGDYDSTIYVLTGAIRIESGAGGKAIVEGQPGDFVFVPKGIVHRESNPSTEQSQVIVIRVGMGAPVVNVEAPE